MRMLQQIGFIWLMLTSCVVQATGLAELEHSPSVILFDSIQERAGKISGDFTPEQKQGLEKAYQRLEYDHDTISKELPDK